VLNDYEVIGIRKNAMKQLVRWLAIVLFSVCAVCFYGQTTNAQVVGMSTLVTELQRGGYVIVFRHGMTHRTQADTDPLNLDNIAQQRQLNEKGQEVAKQVGAAFKKLRIPLGKVYTSKFNRAIVTGQLISGGEVMTSLDITEGGLVVSPLENNRRADALKMLANTMPDPRTNTLIVTHKPNIMDAFGKDWFDVKEGEASVFKPDQSGKATLIRRVQASDWIETARL
jgi:broad specificity phosphatase PhoE